MNRTLFVGPSLQRQSSGVYLPLEGPFIIISQHDEANLIMKDIDWNTALVSASLQGRVFHRLDLSFGYIAYQRREPNAVEVAAFWYDTSD